MVRRATSPVSCTACQLAGDDCRLSGNEERRWAEAFAAEVKEYPVHTLAEGDSLISNDPWLTSGRLNDFTVVTPIFHRGELVGLFANTCHAMDIGGRTLGADAREVFEEGLYVPILKLFERGRPNRDLFKLIKQNVRTPELVEGDLMAQVGGNEVGGEKLIEFMEEYHLTSLGDLSNGSRRGRSLSTARRQRSYGSR